MTTAGNGGPIPGQPRGGRRARADTARRRVRSTRNANSGTIGYGVGREARKMRKSYRRIRRVGPATGLWAVLTAVAAVIAVVTEGLAEIAIAVTLLGVTVAVNRIEEKQGRVSAPPPPRSQTQNRPKQVSGRGSGSSGTSGTGGRGGRPRGSGGGEYKCSEACQRSPKPKNSRNCRCQAKDCKHGALATKTGTP